MTTSTRIAAAATLALWTTATLAGTGTAAPGETQTAAPPTTQPTGSAPAGTAAPQPTPPPPSGTPALVLDTQDYDGLLGKGVRAANGDDLGRIIDIIVDKDGHPRAAIIDFGGFLGVGSRKIAVDWRVLKFSADNKAGRITLMLNRNQVRVSPEYKTGEPIVVLGSPGSGAPASPEGDQAAAPPAVADKPADKPPEKTPEQ